MRKRSDKTYKRILSAASELFIKNGYAATTINEISGHADITKKTLYSYFTDKKTLFLGVLQEAIGTPWEPDQIENGISSKNDLYMALFNIANGINEVYSQPEYPQLLRVIINEIRKYPELEILTQRGITHIALTTLIGVFEDANQSGFIIIRNPKNSAKMFIGGFLTNLYIDGLMTSQDDKIHKLTTLEMFRYINNFLPVIDQTEPAFGWGTLKEIQDKSRRLNSDC